MGRNFRPPLLNFEANHKYLNPKRRLNYLIDANLSDTEYNELVTLIKSVTDISTNRKKIIKVTTDNPGQVKELAQHIVGFNPDRCEVHLREHYLKYFFADDAYKNAGMEKLLEVRDGGYIDSYSADNSTNASNAKGDVVKLNRSNETSNITKFDVNKKENVVLPTSTVEEVVEETKSETNKKNLLIGLLVVAALIAIFVILKKKKKI